MTGKVLSASEDLTARQIAKILEDNNIGGVPVVDGDGSLVGMVSESDLAGPDAEGEPHAGRPDSAARDVMASPVVSVTETTQLPEIARLLTSYRINRLPVVRDGRVVGIVSQSDLVRRMAEEPAKAAPVPRHGGKWSEALAGLIENFIGSRPAPTATPEPAADKAVTADAFHTLVKEFDQRKAVQDDEARRAAVEQHKGFLRDLAGHHVKDATWRNILHQALVAAEAGQDELLVLRFPSELCSDSGRAINITQDGWPETLRGEAAEIYLRWKRDLRPNGFHLAARVLDFPNGIPGDIGLTLQWGSEAKADQTPLSH